MNWYLSMREDVHKAVVYKKQPTPTHLHRARVTHNASLMDSNMRITLLMEYKKRGRTVELCVLTKECPTVDLDVEVDLEEDVVFKRVIAGRFLGLQFPGMVGVRLEGHYDLGKKLKGSRCDAWTAVQAQMEALKMAIREIEDAEEDEEGEDNGNSLLEIRLICEGIKSLVSKNGMTKETAKGMQLVGKKMDVILNGRRENWEGEKRKGMWRLKEETESLAKKIRAVAEEDNFMF